MESASLIWSSNDTPLYMPGLERNPDMDIALTVPVFVAHYTPLTERKTHVDKQLADHGIVAEFITQWDREVLTDFTFFDTKIVSPAQASLFLKHFEAYRQIVRRNIPCALLLEDDVCLAKTFNEELNKTLKNLPPDFDMCFVGDSCGFHIKRTDQTTNVFLKSNEPELIKAPWGPDMAGGSTRATCGYLITRSCAEKILGLFVDSYKVSKLGLDHWLNEVARVLNLKNYWSEPTILCGGSDVGVFQTSLGATEWSLQTQPNHSLVRKTRVVESIVKKLIG